ncbi:MAG: DUF4926 domain-containing protein [Gemmatimonadetes bacterium]|nr:DUF4926 domain-containing protein [Gemmatimonadota bacterium]
MTFRELEIVVLIRDVAEHGLRRGDVGTIVHLHAHDAFEVEFMSASGRTHAVITLTAADVRAAEDRDLVAVRSL